VGSGGQSDRGAGLEAERRAIAAACRRHGWRPLRAVEQAGLSAEDVNRPGSGQTLRLLEAGGANALVAAKHDLLSRSLLDISALLASAHTQGWTLVALDYSLDTSPPAGEPLANLLASFAPFERRLHSQQIRQALARKRAQGARLGRPPTMSPYAIERITRERAAGHSLAAIANGLNADRIPTAQGGQHWHPATIRHTLNRTHRHPSSPTRSTKPTER
jgi:DNA invertase Pin-like site-specific DNA recombinase